MGSSKIVKNAVGKEDYEIIRKNKKFRKRKYKDGTIVIYTKESGAICQCDAEANAQLVLTALNEFYGSN